MNDTQAPRTDEFARAECCDLEHALDFARQMERELAAIAPPSLAMNNITTPRTDALMPTQGRKQTMGEYILEIEEHARRLERELAAERALADRLGRWMEDHRKNWQWHKVDESCGCEDCVFLVPFDETLAAWKEARK